jgi:hypothetical protein
MFVDWLSDMLEFHGSWEIYVYSVDDVTSEFLISMALVRETSNSRSSMLFPERNWVIVDVFLDACTSVQGIHLKSAAAEVITHYPLMASHCLVYRVQSRCY